jgi:hypothetical protein
MANRTYKTARGKSINMNAVMLQNEKVRSVGNMHTNARGDKIDSHGNPIVRAQDEVQQYYEDQNSPSEAPVFATADDAQKYEAEQVAEAKRIEEEAAKIGLEDANSADDEVKEKAVPAKATSGIAGAVAKAGVKKL